MKIADRIQGEYVIILKALNKFLIDEVLGLSKEMNERGGTH